MSKVTASRVWKLAAVAGPVEILELRGGSIRLVIHQAHVGLERAWKLFIEGLDVAVVDNFALAIADIIEECRGASVVTIWKDNHVNQ